ncbi:MAG: hypothetical protein J0I06_27990, partial [Planctomycetes bacterium]|nr:hypothetical protein [Planctomycetota bacterium]
GTLSSRLAAARKRLAERLKARGVAPAAGLSTLLGLLAASARAAVPPALQAGSAAAAAIAGGVLKAMTLAKLKAPVAFAALVLALAAWAPVPPPVPAAAAAPVPKGPDRGVVWVYRPTFGPDARLTLTGYTPGGTKLEEFVLPDRDDCYLGLTPDGRKIAFVGKGGKPAETRKAEGLTVHLRDIGAAEGTDTGIPADSCPVWSRDMKRAVYAHGSRPNGEAGAAYKLLDLATRKETPLGLPADHYPVLWSPDGTWLLVVRRGGVSPVWCRYDLAGGKLETLVDRRFYYYMDLSPDGKTLIGFGQPRPEEPGGPRVRWEIDRFDVATGAMTPADKFAYGPRDGIIMSRWSPDGARVVHAVRECPPMGEESYRIVVCDPDGGNEVKLTAGRGQFMGWIYWLPTRPRPAAPK